VPGFAGGSYADPAAKSTATSTIGTARDSTNCTRAPDGVVHCRAVGWP
jgi:hypothetical protein